MQDEEDDKKKALSGSQANFCAAWKKAIESASDEEKDWREQSADEAVKAYVGDKESSSTSFNIYHSNIETLVPALYNSSPIPDVRRRFNDEDPVASEVSELLERSISFSIDDYDFDDTMKNVVKDMAIVDRGIARVKYEPTLEPMAGPDGVPMEGEGGPEMEVTYEEVICEHVPWKNFRRGPATSWAKLPWLAFEHYLSRDEIEKMLAKKSGYSKAVQAEIMGELKFAYSAESKGDNSDQSREKPTFGARERVWEIWDKDTKTVIFLSHDYGDYPLAVIEDPLKLKGFFPTPRPAMIIQATDKLTPVTGYSIYCKLIDELNEVTERIARLVKQIRVRGVYAALGDEMKQAIEADDGELIPLSNAEMFATTGGGLDKAISWFPIEPVVVAVKELIIQREQIKQTIYEVTGLSDIVRGATNAAETATAQQIKTQWGSIRIQSHQKEVERYARDLFRLKAEVMCKHFSMDTLMMMTGLDYPTQEDKANAEQMKKQGEQLFAEYQGMVKRAQEQGSPPPQIPPEVQQQVQEMAKIIEDILSKPALEEIEAMMRNDRVLRYRVDIESDSTVRADLTKNQEQMKAFLEGTAAYASAVGPMVQQHVMPGEVAVEIYSAFARNFRLGKQAEGALDEWSDKIKKQGIPQQPPDPVTEAEAELKKAQAQRETATAEKTATETQLLVPNFQLTAQEKIANHALQRETASVSTEKTRHDMKMQQDQMDMTDRHHQDQMKETSVARRQSAAIEQARLKDGRKARREGFAAEGKPIPADDMEEDNFMTGDDFERQDEEANGLKQLAQAVQSLADTQHQTAAAMAQAIQMMAQAINAPKEIIRDPKTGKAIGARPIQPQNS